jgi:hypothetical protein
MTEKTILGKIKNHRYFKSMDDEGEDGFWLYLTGDYNCDDPFNPTDLIHEDTLLDCWSILRSLK